LYEADQEFEKMTETLLKNFNSIKSLMPFLRSSLRQTMIRKLSKGGKDKAAWKKAEEYLTLPALLSPISGLLLGRIDVIWSELLILLPRHCCVHLLPNP